LPQIYFSLKPIPDTGRGVYADQKDGAVEIIPTKRDRI